MLLTFAGAEDGLLEISGAGGVIQSNTKARTGTYSFRVSTASNSERYYGFSMLFASRDEIFFQFGINATHLPVAADYSLFSWRNGSVILGCVTVDNGGLGMKVYRGDKSTLLATIGQGVGTNIWTIIEGHIKVHDSDGVIQIKINGSLVMDYSGDTKPGSETAIDNFAFYNLHSNSGSSYHYLDDIIFCDTSGSYMNTWLNGMKIYRRAMTGAGNYAQWTPHGAANNWDCVDETPPSADEYLSGTTGQKDSYAVQDAPTISGIAAIVTRYWCQGGGSIKRLCRMGGSDYLSSAFSLPGAFSKVDDVMYVRPDNSNAWDVSSFNSVELGMEKQ
jgi:hypothetical protein